MLDVKYSIDGWVHDEVKEQKINFVCLITLNLIMSGIYTKKYEDGGKTFKI